MTTFLAVMLILTALLACTTEPAHPPPQAGNDAAPQAVETTMQATQPTAETPTTAATQSPSSATSTPQPTPTPASAAVPEPTPTILPIDGETWILETVGGRPLIDGTYATLTIDGSQFGGFDGCNFFGGRHEAGKPVVNTDGTISVPKFATTAAGCPTDAILEQANRFLKAITQQATAGVVDDRLHIIDGSGDIALVFFKQAPLSGHPIELAGTAW